MSNTIKIAIVDDHELFRDGLKLVIDQIENMEIILDVSNGKDFLKELPDSDFDIALMDINMPELSGIQSTKEALLLKPNLKVIALTMFNEDVLYMEMIKAGAKGFVLKKSGKYELEQAINEVYKGGNYFSPEIIQRFTYRLMHPDTVVYDNLTAREKEVLLLVCKGLTSNEISEKLFISPKTVEVHRTNIFDKIKVRNTAELIIWAVKNKVYIIE